jgi:hypothetical protein
MKKFAFIFGVVLLAAILVAAGYWLGFGARFMRDAFSSTVLDRTLTEASFEAVVLHDLDLGQIDNARSFLRTELDGDIITIWSFGDYSDARDRKMVTNLFAKIATYRAEYPAIYTNHPSGDWANIDGKIASILQQAKQQQTK